MSANTPAQIAVKAYEDAKVATINEQNALASWRLVSAEAVAAVAREKAAMAALVTAGWEAWEAKEAAEAWEAGEAEHLAAAGQTAVKAYEDAKVATIKEENAVASWRLVSAAWRAAAAREKAALAAVEAAARVRQEAAEAAEAAEKEATSYAREVKEALARGEAMRAAAEVYCDEDYDEDWDEEWEREKFHSYGYGHDGRGGGRF